MAKRRAQNSGKTATTRGRPFQPGQSGNPGGRPKLSSDAREAYRAIHPRALERLRELVESKDEGVALRACIVVIERVEGRAVQAHQVAIGKSLEEMLREAMAEEAPRK